MLDVKSIRKWETKLKYIGDNVLLDVYNGNWIVTDYARRPNEENISFQYVVQLLIDNGLHQGVSGLHCWVFTEEELIESFEIMEN